MSAQDNPLRLRVAYLKITQGLLTMKEIAHRLGIGVKLAEYYWATAQRMIRNSGTTNRNGEASCVN
jgi:hypothetical protein